jgi:dTMP kinase
MPGHLIIFEGPDGVGKTKRCHDTAKYITGLGIKNRVFAFPGKVPGSLGHVVHMLHNSPSKFGLGPVMPAALQTLHIAAQVDAIERKILPLLSENYCILLDRFWWSTWVYGSEAGVAPNLLEAMVTLENMAWRGKKPNAAFLIDRAVPFRQEQSSEKFSRLRSLYRELAAKEQSNYGVFNVNAVDSKSIEPVIQRAVDNLLGIA